MPALLNMSELLCLHCPQVWMVAAGLQTCHVHTKVPFAHAQHFFASVKARLSLALSATPWSTTAGKTESFLGSRHQKLSRHSNRWRASHWPCAVDLDSTGGSLRGGFWSCPYCVPEPLRIKPLLQTPWLAAYTGENYDPTDHCKPAHDHAVIDDRRACDCARNIGSVQLSHARNMAARDRSQPDTTANISFDNCG
jgi:hypothetical protein